MSLAPWRSPLSHALYRNRSLASSRYLQLATIGLDGRPRNRTVVFRGFLEATDQLQMVTDSRSQKILEIHLQPWVEVCWYFSKTREQFRLNGQITVISAETNQTRLSQIRNLAWQELSDAARIQFAWPTPKMPLMEDKEAFHTPPPPRERPIDNFCLLLLDPVEVDHLELRGEPQNRILYSLDQHQNWNSQAVNP